MHRSWAGVGFVVVVSLGCSPADTIDGRDGADSMTSDDGDAPELRVQNIDLDALEVGQCVDTIDEDREVFFSLPVVDCAGRHAFEVTSNAPLVGFGSEFPGDAAIEEHALDACLAVSDEYVGRSIVDSDDLDFWYFAPVRSSWSLGGRSLQCLVQLIPPRRGSIRA